MPIRAQAKKYISQPKVFASHPDGVWMKPREKPMKLEIRAYCVAVNRTSHKLIIKAE